MEFRVGDKVVITNGAGARSQGAGNVRTGDTGTVTNVSEWSYRIKFDRGDEWYVSAGNLKLKEESDTIEGQALYKAVHVNEAVRGYESIFAGQDEYSLFRLSKLSYVIGQVTDAGEGEYVRCWETKKQAILHASGKSGLIIAEPTAVLEVYPVACTPKTDDNMGMVGAVKAQRVYVMRVVSQEQPEPAWVDVTMECELSWLTNVDHHLISVCHKEQRICMMGANQIETAYLIDCGEYKIVEDARTAQGTQWFKVMKRVS